MFKHECAIIQAYTGVCMLTGKDAEFYHRYINELFGRPVYTHEIPELTEEISKRSKKDFERICSMAIDLEEIATGLFDFIADKDKKEE